MPDVALASGSLSAIHLGGGSGVGAGLGGDPTLGSLEALHDLEGTQMSLDLGDGSHHQVSHLYSSISNFNRPNIIFLLDNAFLLIHKL